MKKNQKKIIIQNIISINKIINELTNNTVEQDGFDSLEQVSLSEPQTPDKIDYLRNIYQPITHLARFSRSISSNTLTMQKIKSNLLNLEERLKKAIESNISLVTLDLIGELAEITKILSATLIYLPFRVARNIIFYLSNLTPMFAYIYEARSATKEDLLKISQIIKKLLTTISGTSFIETDFALKKT